MPKGKYQVQLLGNDDASVEKQKEVFSRILDILLRKQKPELLD